jgi:hypothetical protein
MLDSTVHFLVGAGWVQGRHIDTTPFVVALTQSGYEMFPKQIEFLSEFGGLVIVGAKQVIVRFDVLELLVSSVGSYEDEGLDNYASHLGVRWSIIGQLSLREPKLNMEDWSLILMMTDDGVIYGVGDGYERIAGCVDNGAAIDNLCRGMWDDRNGWVYQPSPGYPRNTGNDEARR